MKINQLIDDVTELKILIAKQEINSDRQNEILDRLTSSVEHHIERTDKLEELVSLLREEAIKNVATIKSEVHADLIPIKNHISFIKGAAYTLGVVGAIILGLNQLGILSKIL